MSRIVRATAAGLLYTGVGNVGVIHLKATTASSVAQITDAVAGGETTKILGDLAAVANGNDCLPYRGAHFGTGVYVESITSGAVVEVEIL